MATIRGLTPGARSHAIVGVVVSLCAVIGPGCGRVGYDPAVGTPPDTRLATQDGSVDPVDGAADANPNGDDGARPHDGPTSDAIATASDTSPDVSPPSTITLPYLQDFEAPTDSWSGKFIGSEGIAVRDVARQYGGVASLKCSKGNQSGLRYLEISLPKALTTGEIYSRVFMYVPSSWAVQQWLVPMEMKGTVSHDNKFSFDLGSKGYGSNLSDVSQRIDEALTFPHDRWVCVELALKLSPNKGWSRLYVDGNLVDENIDVNTLLSTTDPGIQRFRVGLIPAPSQKSAEIWFDDWAIATSRIGCL
ncbi:MAG: hypothetical protein SF187_21895 [Deltaproteobacteria bacterium]|nr:hypothetical protein [Deltaproteobacteria bacterium]